VPYGAIDHRIWTSFSIKQLSDNCKLAFIYILTSPHSNMIGFYYLPIPYMAHDLGWTIDTAKKNLLRLCEESTGPLVRYDFDAEVVLVPRYLRYNPLATGNRQTGAISRLRELPSTPLVQWFHGGAKQFACNMEKMLTAIEEIESSQSLDGVLEGIGESAYTVAVTDAVTDAVEYVATGSEDFELFWNEFKAMKRGVGKVAAKKAWHTTTFVGRPGDGGHRPIEFAVLIQAAKHYRMSCEQEKTDPKFIKQPATFLGPDRNWEDWKDKPKPSSNGNGTNRALTRGAEEFADVFEEA